MLVRKTPAWRRTRRALTVTALAALVTGGAFLGTGTASAATTLASACTGSVNGSMGDSVALPGSSVKEVVRQAAQQQVSLFNFLTVWPDSLANTIAGKGNLQVGQIPQSAGGTIGGEAIGTAVAGALKGASGLGLTSGTQNQVLAAIENKVASSCALTTLATNYTAPTSSAPTTGPANGGRSPADPATGSGGAPLANLLPGGNGGTAPQRDYNGIPTATPGTAIAPGIRYPAGGALPGAASAPQLGGPDSQGQGPDIRNAGNAEALANSGGHDVQLPMLLAVIVLAGVTAGLVRTWVLHRAA
ncbi:hypothetical protein [Amycolatopsis sp. PS_44_ISF1]|uniref:hypothetical protein n=1 Tax=Amycolatopsis sp. PS_44_ISF1 TaxID=2974917 RepID=UPI0028DD9863|nr:hypothetical protein [Amycolatopsis sp. PS_44_ISF1]MDT8910496.1 hypothetical protein [Amycolatopsis sp. PS_44_ISF1]